MVRFSHPDCHQFSRISNFLAPNDEDDRKLDLIQTPLSVIESDDDDDPNFEPELNPYPDDNDQIIDENNITFGITSRGRRELNMCGYSYQVKEENISTTRWRCIIRSPACPVTIHTNNVDDSFIYWNGAYHSHSPDENRELMKSVIAKIKARVLLEPHPVVFIAEEEIRNAKMTKAQLLAMPLPSAMETALQKHRRKNIPPLPTSINFDIPLLYQRIWSGQEFVIADITSKRVGGRLIMFRSNEQVELLLNSSIWFCDGTFKTRPLLFSQVYIVQCLVGETVFPAIYALTSNRKRKTYEQIIQVILNIAAARNQFLKVQTIVSDYEGAWLRAVENLLPNVVPLGCFFHFGQACYRNIQSLGLSRLYDNDPDIRLALRKFIAIALVPRSQVKKSFKLLCKNSDHRIQPFIEYFKQQWLKDMSPDLWCVANSEIRTNNSSEAYNRRFASRMLHKHLAIYIHIEKRGVPPHSKTYTSTYWECCGISICSAEANETSNKEDRSNYQAA